MPDLFEIVEDLTELESEVVNVEPVREGLVWCEFCKGYYIEEFHYGRTVDEDEE